ncbi:hypothetical protein OBBRIDRAFT_508282 [Obba rivulosa]|uniref:Uncharacterized protein n=1 Tax=Obba rivulosa TaxID=1052685 RepID=A0A8E2B0L6_9APHY|nr:hypothetical protein OBBRIDRAFT_508282 [Obba rivulosa]
MSSRICVVVPIKKAQVAHIPRFATYFRSLFTVLDPDGELEDNCTCLGAVRRDQYDYFPLTARFHGLRGRRSNMHSRADMPGGLEQPSLLPGGFKRSLLLIDSSDSEQSSSLDDGDG